MPALCRNQHDVNGSCNAGNAYVPRYGRITDTLDGMSSTLAGEDALIYLVQATMGITVTAARPQAPPVPATPENVLMSAQATGADIIFCVPSFIEVGLAMTPTPRMPIPYPGLVPQQSNN